MTKQKELYRFYDSIYGDSDYRINLETFYVVRDTPCGYWYTSFASCMSEEYKDTFWKWVSNHGRVRRCYETKEDAWDSFCIRKRKQKMHLTRALERCDAIVESLTDQVPVENNIKIIRTFKLQGLGSV